MADVLEQVRRVVDADRQEPAVGACYTPQVDYEDAARDYLAWQEGVNRLMGGPVLAVSSMSQDCDGFQVPPGGIVFTWLALGRGLTEQQLERVTLDWMAGWPGRQAYGVKLPTEATAKAGYHALLTGAGYGHEEALDLISDMIGLEQLGRTGPMTDVYELDPNGKIIKEQE